MHLEPDVHRAPKLAGHPQRRPAPARGAKSVSLVLESRRSAINRGTAADYPGADPDREELKKAAERA